MKKIEHPNRGHLVPDIIVSGIARAFEMDDNISIVLDSNTGIETPDSILRNEVVRLIISKKNLSELIHDLELIQQNFPSTENPPIETPPEQKTDDRKNEKLGKSFSVL